MDMSFFFTDPIDLTPRRFETLEEAKRDAQECLGAVDMDYNTVTEIPIFEAKQVAVVRMNPVRPTEP
jgi:hypothetical protein